MNSKLSDNKYLIVRNFIPVEQAKNLAKSFCEFEKENPKDGGDSLCPDTYCHYNFLPFVSLSLDKLSDIEKIVETKLFPTYTYARIYREGDDLVPHTDRPACELSVTLNLDCDQVWDIWFCDSENLENREYVSLKPGDGIIYLGPKIIHARDRFEGSYCCQVFLHFVQQEGDHKDHYFDHLNYTSFRVDQALAMQL